MAQLIREHYGDGVQVVYIDLTGNWQSEYPAVAKVLDGNRVPLPVVFYNDEPLWAGGLSYASLARELKERGIEPIK